MVPTGVAEAATMSTFWSFIVLTSVTLLFIAILWLKKNESILNRSRVLCTVLLSLFECPRELISAIKKKQKKKKHLNDFLYIFLHFPKHLKQRCCYFSHVFQISVLQKGPWWFLIHSGGFLTSSASCFHVVTSILRLWNSEFCFPIRCLTIPSTFVCSEKCLNFQFPPQSIRNINLALLDTIYDIYSVDMQKQGTIFKMNYNPCPLAVGCRIVYTRIPHVQMSRFTLIFNT